ncbi:uncharacterized protein BN724_00610 [Clostridium sp. CAG:590]|nr:uncharacterized protein BN724_00610 [Clostridium sp. CAG:590]
MTPGMTGRDTMITTFIMNHLFMCSIVLFGVLSILLQWIMALSLNGYVKASSNMKTTKKKLLLNLKNQFETIYGMDYQVRNIAAYVDKYLLKMRFLGVSYSSWEKAPFLSVGLATLLAGGELFYGYWTGQPKTLFVEIGFAYGAICVCEFVFYHLCAVHNKRQQIHIQLVDYLENYLTNRLMRSLVENKQLKMLDADMEAAFMDGSVKNKEIKNVILEEEKKKGRKEKREAEQEKLQETYKGEEDAEEDMEMLKRLLREMGKRQTADDEKTGQDIEGAIVSQRVSQTDSTRDSRKNEEIQDEVAVADENMEPSDIELLEEFVQSFLA